MYRAATSTLPRLQYFQKLFRRSGVLEQHAVHIEWVEIAVAELIDRAGDVGDEFGRAAASW